MLTISGPLPYWPPSCGARKMSPSPLSAPLVSTVTGGACVPAGAPAVAGAPPVAAGPDEHETTAAHSAPVTSAAATLNFTGTSRQSHPRGTSLTPDQGHTSQVLTSPPTLAGRRSPDGVCGTDQVRHTEQPICDRPWSQSARARPEPSPVRERNKSHRRASD